MKNYSRFYALLNRLPCSDRNELKTSLVLQYTNGRTGSLKEVTDKEYDNLCAAMQEQVGGDKVRQIARENLRRKRSSVLHQMQKMGINTADWNVINDYCKHPRIAGAEFRKLTEDELDMLLIKLKMIQKKESEKMNHSYLN